MNNILKILKYAGVLLIVVECIKSAVTKVSEQYPELLESKKTSDVNQ